MKHVISLGAGVQSSTMALMAAVGEITPMPEFAIFADTMAEPDSVYVWLDWLEKQLPFPVHRVNAGGILSDALLLHVKKDNSGFYSDSHIPAYTLNPDGTTGITPRQCTSNHKIIPILRELKSQFKAEISAFRKTDKTEPVVTQWIGITTDEISRMKESREPWSLHRWPLVDLGMNREACLRWMEKKGFPRPPRSACFFCPFKSNAEWSNLKKEEPHYFQKAVMVERAYRAVKGLTGVDSNLFLHRSCVPLDQVDFRTDFEKGQINLFQNECEGMCGV